MRGPQVSKRYASVCGRIVPVEEARVSILDRGMLYGDGLFETIRVRGGECVRLERHMERLRAGAEVLRFGDALDGLDFAAMIRSVLDANGLADARVRLTVTRGESAGAGRIGRSDGPPTVTITADPLTLGPPEPADVIVATIRRDESSPLSRIKSLNYLPSILARIEAEEAGADDAVLLNSRGMVSDGTVGNVFVVMGGCLIAPSLDQGPLPGTVRAAVIELAPQLGLQVIQRAVSLDELAEAGEVFFTNAIQLVRPVGSVGGRAVGVGHAIAERVREALR